MLKFWLNYGLMFLLSLTVVACAATTPSMSPSKPTEASPQTEMQAQKVVALTPLTADIVYQLAPNKLVGIPGNKLTSDNIRFQNLMVVSAERTPPNLEKIVALQPSLVIGAAGFHDQTLDKLKQLNIPTLTTEVISWAALQELTKTLARSLNADPQPLLDRYQTCFANPPTQTPSTLMLVSRQPILAPNQTSWAGDFLAQFKVNNLASELQGDSPMRGYITLSPEKILQSNPEIMILVDTGDDILAQFKADSFWNKLQAVKNNRVYVFDYYGLVNPGSISRIEKACTQLKQIFPTR
jgi:iron complex transport system substrate-binding protein